jgi:dTDP-4-amino-4,6-dideoxygalactose transaminase
MAGATPRFADIDPATFNLSPEDTESRLTVATRAILLVDQIGLPADLDAFAAVARKHGLILIEDAATAFGARYKGRVLGGHGVPTCFSFHPRKVITTGEGGLFTTPDEEAAERARALRSAGASVSDLARHTAKGVIVPEYHEPGYNYRMTDIQAAIGCVQLGKLPEIQRQRAEQAAVYDDALRDLDELAPPHVPAFAEHAYSSYCVRVRDPYRVSAAEIVTRMAARGVSCRHGIQPLHFEPYFRSRMPGLSLPATEAAARETFFLPIVPGLRADQQRFIIESLKQSLKP